MTSLRDVLSRISEHLTAIGEAALEPNVADAGPETGGTATEACEQILAMIAATRYGSHDLQQGDRDDSGATRRIWGGVENAADNAGAPPAETDEPSDEEPPQHVRQLQTDLRALGFAIVGNPNGDFGRTTQMAVREFQIYARMEYVARIRAAAPAVQRVPAHEAAQLGPNATGTLSQYVDSLEQVCNNARYSGPVSGAVNADTRRALRHWIDNNWRCPVIIEAWNISNGNRSTLFQDGGSYKVNLWTKEDLRSTTPRAFYRDFTTYYTYPATRDRNEMHGLGEYASYSTWYGPVSVPPRHCWTEAELLPERLTGNANPTGNTLSTYKVVRAGAEQECLGHFDSITAYDRAVISVGPCHWTICLLNASNNNVSAGEMGGLLSYFEHSDAAAFENAVKNFGLKASLGWENDQGVANGSALWSNGQKKFASLIALQQENGGFAQMPSDKRDYEYLRNWHWFFRWAMAGRTIAGYQRCMWTMARMRIRDIFATPWGGAVHGHTGLTIGDIFTSERAVAMLYRLHIWSPASIAAAAAAGSYLRGVGGENPDQGALARAQAETPAQAGAGNIAGNTLDWTVHPNTWTDEHEAALIRAYVRTVEARNNWREAEPGQARPPEPGIRVSTRAVRDWPNWSLTGSNPRRYTLANTVTAGGLSASRNSFDFDDAGLPPAV